MYQLADYKARGLRGVPSDVAKTSVLQDFHQPRGQKICGAAVQDLHMKACSSDSPETRGNGVPSVLYNPISGGMPDMTPLADSLEKVAPNFLIIPALRNYHSTPMMNTKFGNFPIGSAVATQQQHNSLYCLNILDGVDFPRLPVADKMINNFNIVLTQPESVMLQDLQVTQTQSHNIEMDTRLQSDNSLWHQMRSNRITASKAHLVFRRQKNFETLTLQLKSTRRVQTQAMRDGLADEPKAAAGYVKAQQYTVNILPCGIVVSPWACWLAASPDRKVYMPSRAPSFGLLEIKCPRVLSVLQVSYLKSSCGSLQLDRKHEYYTQVQTQQAVTGLEWCDFFVWSAEDFHLETIYFDPDFWQLVKDKIDQYYFSYFTKC